MNAEAKMVPQLVFKFHELSNCLPLLDDLSFESFCENMQKNGQLQKAKIFRGEILDGRNRYNASIKLGIPFQYEEFKGSYEDAAQYVASANLERRHLTTSQKACCAVLLHDKVKMSPSDAAKFRDKCTNKHLPEYKRRTSERVASMFGISAKIIHEATTVRNRNKKLFDMCFNGQMKVSHAHGQVARKNSKYASNNRVVLPEEPLPEKIIIPNVFESLDIIMVFHKQLLAKGFECHIKGRFDGKFACQYLPRGIYPKEFKDLDYCPDIRSSIVSSGREVLTNPSR